MKKPLISSILILVSLTIFAQADFRPGYIISKGDTTYGEIDYRGDLLMGQICRFRQAENEVHEFTPDEIESYRFIESKYFVSRELDGKNVFLEFLIKGKISIYYLRHQGEDRYYIEKDGQPLTLLPYEEGIITREGMDYAYKSKSHIGILTYFMEDASGLKSKIVNIEKPEHQNLVNLAKEYHKMVCSDEECTIYEKKQKQLQAKIEVMSGIHYVVDEYTALPGPYFNNGFLINLWLPRVNEKLYLRTGLFVSKHELKKDTYTNFYRIPFQLGYITPDSHKIRPNFAIGLFSPNYTAGVMATLNKRISVGVEAWANFYSKNTLFFVPHTLEGFYFMGAVYFNL